MSLRLGVLVSGRGSNLEAILRAIKNGELNATVEIVISNRPEAMALMIARNYGVHAIAIDQKGMTRTAHEHRVLEELESHSLDYVVLAGYMRLLSPEFLGRFKHSDGYFKVINIHPSLLPDFPGANAYEDAYNAGVPESGISVHLVDEQMDSGPILAQVKFPRLKQDSLDDFKNRGLRLEHSLFPAVLQDIAQHGIKLAHQGRAIS
jgi:phosphoribosylglycinamide formyltransferase 1